MMTGEQLYPFGHHPSYPTMDIINFGPAHTIRRRDIATTNPVKYYFIDFEAGIRFEESEEKSVYLTFCQDDDLPENDYDVSHDPFPADVFSLGNVYRKKFYRVCLFWVYFRSP